MAQEFYYQPIKQPRYLAYLLYFLFFSSILVFLILLAQTLKNPNKDISTLIKNFTLLIVPILLLGKYIISNREISTNTPIFIFDENHMVFNHPTKSFNIAWQDIQDINQSFMFNIPTLLIYTKHKKYKIELKYFQGVDNLNNYPIFKDYVIKYSGKKLLL